MPIKKITKSVSKNKLENIITETHQVNDQMIIFQGVKTHNLRNIDVSFPKNQIITITGVSGSGKSSLAFDTIYKEGQFRYIAVSYTHLDVYKRQDYATGAVRYGIRPKFIKLLDREVQNKY